jgi:rubredoxin
MTKMNSHKFKCRSCGYVYDPEAGDLISGILPGTPFEEISDDWICPLCGVRKTEFTEFIE